MVAMTRNVRFQCRWVWRSAQSIRLDPNQSFNGARPGVCMCVCVYRRVAGGQLKLRGGTMRLHSLSQA